MDSLTSDPDLLSCIRARRHFAHDLLSSGQLYLRLSSEYGCCKRYADRRIEILPLSGVIPVLVHAHSQQQISSSVSVSGDMPFTAEPDSFSVSNACGNANPQGLCPAAILFLQADIPVTSQNGFLETDPDRDLRVQVLRILLKARCSSKASCSRISSCRSAASSCKETSGAGSALSEASCPGSCSACSGVSEKLFKEVPVISLFSSLEVKARVTAVAIAEKPCLPAFSVSKASPAASETAESALEAIRPKTAETAV